MNATVYARLYVQRGSALPAAYSASYPIALRYGVVNGGFVNCNALASAPGGKTAAGGGGRAATPAAGRKR